MEKKTSSNKKIKNCNVANPQLAFACLQVVKYYRNLPGFQLLQEKEFVELLYNRCEKALMDEKEISPRTIALNIYTESIFQAVVIKEDSLKQEVGFQELSKYLYRIAYNFFLNQTSSINDTLEKAQECTQAALECIFTNMHCIEKPGGFLKWCSIILRNICIEEVRKRKREIPINYEEENNIPTINCSQEIIETEVDKKCLEAAILRLKKRYADVIRLSFLSIKADGGKFSDEEIAKALNISIKNLYTLRSRAVSALRNDSCLRKCIQNKL